MMKTALLLVLLQALIAVVSPQSQTHVFYLVPVEMSWSAAQKHCRRHYTDLASIDDREDYEELLKTVNADFKGEWIWTGLYRTSGTAPWIWSDQSQSTFRSWADGQPNNHGGTQFCAGTSPTGTFNDADCSIQYAAVCYDKRRRQAVRLTVKSSQNVNDPEVKSTILGKVDQMLKENGFTEDVKLSYRNQSDGNVFQKTEQKMNVTKQTSF
ncbi:C-type lectin BfL-2 isoform X2 [Puntigrus tetrazona]|uniref:C-type lectin BfL-2 isoform X2 n=1 Tax=Puntigrus tetrazona TaxID=1606681 RepID=UPI001C8973B0|nr:C-type lectin BfL-2 isoform X2 [Puntigrus tetrazona]